MRYASQFHMPVVLLDHGNTGAKMFGEGIYRHSVVSQRHRCVVVPEAIHVLTIKAIARPANPTSTATMRAHAFVVRQIASENAGSACALAPTTACRL